MKMFILDNFVGDVHSRKVVVEIVHLSNLLNSNCIGVGSTGNEFQEDGVLNINGRNSLLTIICVEAHFFIIFFGPFK